MECPRSVPPIYINPVASGSQSTIPGKKTISTSPMNMNRSSQMS